MTTIITSNTGHEIRKSFFTIRPAVFDDAAAISIVELKAVKDENRMVPLGMTLNQLLHVWQRRIEKKEYEIFVACSVENSARVYGFISIQAHSNKEAYIHAIYIDPQYYRHGIGSALINFCEKIFARRFCPSTKLYVEPYNRIGLRFYNQLGFKLTNKKFHHLHILVKEYSSC